uniref:calcium homeostasis modulator protein 6-like n=1 Tax=Styela clava TaxID=7725 RepID=UPI001939F0C9|nr:calcium homeostasis modulator protein 6-like [Styela clava]
MPIGAKSFATSAAKSLTQFKGTALNTGIAVLTVVLEEVLNRAVYYCPCVTPSELGDCFSTSNSINSSFKCTAEINHTYGLSYIFGPAIALFFFMAASSPRLWKTLTGCCNKDKDSRRRKDRVLWTFIEIFGRALIAPVTWVCFALLDGRYYACAVTPLPYDIGKTGHQYSSCTEVAKAVKPAYSDAYSDNRSYSQIWGWVSIASCVAFAFVIYSISRCGYPLTYYHAKYFDLYRRFEEEEFDDEMKIKAQKEAESNIRKFMSKNREKALWDRISTVFSFHRNPKNIALYSYLHEFIIEEEKNKPLLEIEAGVVETTTTVSTDGEVEDEV